MNTWSGLLRRATKPRKCDVLGLGEYSLDVILRVDRLPTPGTKADASCYELESGGQVATTLLALQHWGWCTGFLGPVAGDTEAGVALERLRRAGVELPSEIVAGARTRRAVVLVSPDGERVVAGYRDSRLTLGSAQRSDAGNARVFHLDLSDAGAAIAMAGRAHRAGVVVSADLDELNDAAWALIGEVDIAVVSAHGAKAGQVEDPKAVLEAVAAAGPALVCITRGEDGCLVHAEGHTWEQSARAVDAVDTTGCGDVFRAGLIHGLLKGWGLERTVGFAASAGARQSLGVGVQRAVPTLAEIADDFGS